MTKEMKRQLAEFIKQAIIQEFSTIYFSGNLRDTIMIEETEDGYDVVIPAQLYNVDYYMEHGVILYDRMGSYASEVDKQGGFSKTHTNYVERCIQQAITLWMSENQIEGKVE